MSEVSIDLKHLPLQRQLVESACDAFMTSPDVLAAVLLGSLASGSGDRVSDADILLFTQVGRHSHLQHCFAQFESDKDIFYCLDGHHSEHAYFKKYIFHDFTSAEIHCLDLNEPFQIARPFQVLFDKCDLVPSRLTDDPPPQHEDFPVYTRGDDGLIWELFDCIKWLSRDHHALAKGYLTRLVKAL